MRNNIEYTSLSTSLVRLLIEKLTGITRKESEDFRAQLKDLEEGICSSLILEMEDVNMEKRGNDVFSYQELEMIPKYRKVIVSGEEISLTPKEYDILYFLASNQGEIFTKEQIYRAVWEDEYLMDDSNIMSFIRKLRKKIEPNPDAPRYILTVWGIGYKFNDQ